MMIHRSPQEIPDGKEKTSVLSHRIGMYYWDLARLLLRGTGKIKKLPQNDYSGDLWHEGLDSLLEVKGGSNRAPFQVYERQLDQHLERMEEFPPVAGFYLYLLFGYQNAEWKTGKNGKKNTSRILSARVHSQRELETTLAKQTDVCFVVDAHLLDAIRRDIGTRRVGRHDWWSPTGHRKIVPVTRTIFRRIAADPRGELRRLGFGKQEVKNFVEVQPRRDIELSRSSIDPISISLKFRQRRVEFQMFLIVPTTMRKKIEKLVLGNGNGHNEPH